jgi:hypothetical protein
MDKAAVLRKALFSMLASLSACAPAASTPPEKAFVLADPKKYKTDAERDRAQQLAEADCKVKALTASAEIEKTIASEKHGQQSVDRAREKAAEMYTAAFTQCMLSNGYVSK